MLRKMECVFLCPEKPLRMQIGVKGSQIRFVNNLNQPPKGCHAVLLSKCKGTFYFNSVVHCFILLAYSLRSVQSRSVQECALLKHKSTAHIVSGSQTWLSVNLSGWPVFLHCGCAKWNEYIIEKKYIFLKSDSVVKRRRVWGIERKEYGFWEAPSILVPVPIPPLPVETRD